jgi:hypothetical protein
MTDGFTSGGTPATGKPSEITRALLAWRYDLPDRTVRRLQHENNVVAIRWR